MKKGKKIILGTISIGVLIAATLVPIFLFSENEENNQETDQKTVDDYVEKLKKLTPKEVTIKETSGSVTKNKSSILSAIKNLDNFPSIPSGVTLEVKDDPKNLTLQGTNVTLVVKKLTISKEVTGFKAKKSKTKVESDTDSINNVKKILDDKSSKLVTIVNAISKVGTTGVPIKIVAELEKSIGTSNLDGVTIGVKADATDGDIIDTGQGTGFIITLSKGTAQPVEIANWKVKRTKTQSELDVDSINSVKKILDDKSSKLVTIENVQAKVGNAGANAKILAEIEKAIGPSNLAGVTIGVKADATDGDIIDTGQGTGFIITLSKGSVQPVEIANWKVKRTKPSEELDTDSVNNVKKIVNEKGSKLVTIENDQAKVGDVEANAKIVAELEKTIGPSNLAGVTISVRANSDDEDIIDTGEGTGFIMTLSKGSVSEEISDWKVKRTKPSEELDTDSVNNVKKIVNEKGSKLVTIENVQAKVGDSRANAKIVAEIEKAIGPSNLAGVTIGVKADATNGDIIDTGEGTGFIMTLSKGSASEEISDWKVKRTKPSEEVDTDSVNNVKKIVEEKGSKLVTIENVQAKVGDPEANAKIVAEIEKAIGPSNLAGVTIGVKADATDGDIIDTGEGTGFIMTLSKGSVSEEISDWKIIRTKPSEELDTNSVNNVKKIVEEKGSKVVTIENVQAKVGDARANAKIVAELEKAIGPSNLAGVTIGVKADATDGDIIDTGEGTGFIMTLSKGSASEEISNWKVKRTKPSEELDTDSVNNVKKIVEEKGSKLVTIENVQAKVGDARANAKIVAELEKAIGPSNLAGVTISVKADATDGDIIDTGEGTGFIMTLSKGSASEEISNWKVKRTKPSEELDTDSVNNVKKIVEEKGSKLVTIENVQAKVGDARANAKIVAELEKAIGPSNLAGVTISVKADATNGDIIDTGEGTGFIMTLSKGSASEEVRNWKVIRTKPQSELDTEFINNVKAILDKEDPKLVTIINVEAKVGDEGVANKILAKLKKIIKPANLNDVTIEIKADSDDRNIIDYGGGTEFIITLSKGSGQPVNIIDWKVIRTKPQFELDADSINGVQRILSVVHSPKLVTIENVQAKVGDSGVPEKIVAEIKKILGPSVLDGVTIEAKADAIDEDIIDTGNGIGFIITLSKGDAPSVDVTNWKVKRTKTSDETISDNYKNVLIDSYKDSFNNPSITKILIKIDSASGTTLEQNKASIIKAIKESYPFVLPPAGFDIRLKANQDEIITTIGVGVDIEIFKISTQNALTSILKGEVYSFKVQKNQTLFEKINSYFSSEDNKIMGAPYESPTIDSSYKNLDDNGVLTAIKKALFFANPDFWTTTLLNEITLKENQNINNLDAAKDIVIKHGKTPNEQEITINVKKYSKGETIEKYFTDDDNKYFNIPSWINIENPRDILNAIKDILVSRDSKVWTITKDIILTSRNNQTFSLTKGSPGYSFFKVRYQFNEDEEKEIKLFVRHLSNGLAIYNYFLIVRNDEARKINIPSSTATLNTAEKIFDAIKNQLKAKDPWTWKDQLLNELTISSSNNTASLTKGDLPKPFIVQYTDNASKVVTLMLKVKHLS